MGIGMTHSDPIILITDYGRNVHTYPSLTDALCQNFYKVAVTTNMGLAAFQLLRSALEEAEKQWKADWIDAPANDDGGEERSE